MRPTRIVPALITACLIASTSCGDAAAPTSPRRLAPPASPLATLEGMVQFSSTDPTAILLSLDDGEEVALASQVDGLANVENAEVEVHGQWNGDTFAVYDFLVRRVDGVDVLDGVVTALRGQEIDGDIIGYGLTMTGGSIIPLSDPPAELIQHLGDRVWVAESIDGQPRAFGIISHEANELGDFPRW
jgi:hypothetical protein